MTCPICRKPTDPKYRPFCSRRCAYVDLGRWLNGTYVIPGDEAADRPGPQDGPEAPDPATPRRH